MTFFKSGYWNQLYFADYWQEQGEGAIATLEVNAGASVAWGGQGGLPDAVPVQPEQVIGGAAKSALRPLLKPWEAFEPEIVWAQATITGMSDVEARALYDDPAELAAEAGFAAAIEQREFNDIDEDDQIVLSFVTAFLSAENGCEINGIFS